MGQIKVEVKEVPKDQRFKSETGLVHPELPYSVMVDIGGMVSPVASVPTYAKAQLVRAAFELWAHEDPDQLRESIRNARP